MARPSLVSRGRRAPGLQFECRLVELFDPVVAALAELGDDPEVLVRLAVVCEGAVIWPLELGPETLAKTPPHDPRLARVQLVDMADQCGLLAALVARAAQMAPDNARIATAAGLVARAEAIFHRRSPSLPSSHPA